MDQKNSKIVLFMTMLFCLEFVQARPDGPDLPTAEERAEEYAVELSQVLGMGSCTTQRFSELTQAMVQCGKQNEAKLQTGGPAPASNTMCTVLGTMLQCMDPLGECYTIQEFNTVRVKTVLAQIVPGATLQVSAELFKDKEIAAKFENCQQYKDLAGKGSIAGINMGIIIALFIIVAYFGI